MDANESRIQRLTEVLKNAKELVQSKSLRQEDLKFIRNVWKEQGDCLEEAEREGNHTVQEMILDLEIIYSTSCVIGQHIRELQTSTKNFSAIEYAEKLVANFSVNEEMDWLKMSDDVVRIINRAPGMPTLLGTFGPAPPAKKVEVRPRKNVTPQSKGKDEIAEKQVAGKVENLAEDKDSVDLRVGSIMKILNHLYQENANQPISFYRFVLHPTNFTATVENIFYISFMIRDGLARLTADEADDIVISPIMKEGKTDRPNSKKSQMVLSITMEEWRSLVEMYGVTEPLIQS